MAEFNLKEYLQNNILLEDKKELPKSIADKERADIEKDAKKAKGMIKVSELKAEIKEMILASLAEEPVAEAEEDEEEVEMDVEDEIDVEAEPSPEPSRQVGLTPEEQSIQASLKDAYDNAMAMGDEKLADQIGNSITFFTRTHVVER